jgi:hypothetical protein
MEPEQKPSQVCRLQSSIRERERERERENYDVLVGSWWKGESCNGLVGHDSWVVYFYVQHFKQKNKVSLEPHVKL